MQLMPSWATMGHRWCCVLWIMSCSKPSPGFFLHHSGTGFSQFQPSKECFSRSGLTFLDVFLEKSNLALCAACGEPSVFALVKSSLDCRFWQWHIYLLDSVLLLAGCCKRGFLYHGEDPLIIHHCCPLWPSRSFVLLSSPVHSFFFSQNVPNCWFGHS